jgi:predicted porin
MLNEGEMLMKKSLIALAVAGAMTAPMVAQADATLYGSFRAGLAFQDGEDADLRDEATRVGIKGEVDLGLEDTKGLFHWEAAINTTDNGGDVAGKESGNFASRLAFLGATGNWGTALVGRQYHPYYNMVNSHTNIFNSADGEFSEAFALGNKHHKREDNTLAYASPVMGGFQVVAGMVIESKGESDKSGTYDEDVDGYNIGVEYTGVEGLRVSASYGDVDTNAGSVGTNNYESEIWGLGATYQVGNLTVAAKYEEREDKNAAVIVGAYPALAGATSAEFDVWELAAQYQMGATALKARYGNIDGSFSDGVGSFSDDGDQWGIEVEHKLGNRGRVWVGYTDLDEEAAALSTIAANRDVVKNGVVAEDTLVIGYRLDF